MIRKTLFGILFVCTAILLLSVFVSSVSASTLYVPDDYTTIQAAVDAAGPGDVIVVRDGTYKENVDVNKPHLTIKSENGDDKTTVEAVTSSYDDIVFEVTEDYVNIIGFTIKAGDYGIYLNIVHHCNIQNNNISTDCGIYLSESSNNNIIKNTILGCWFGIHLSNSFSNNINNNILLNNGRGIHLEGSKNIVSNNTVSYNGAEGIYLLGSKSNSISNNTVSHNGHGIVLDGESERNNLTNNVVLHNKKGIESRSLFPNNICNNIVSTNSYGLHIFGIGAHVSNNIVSNNTYGIYLTGSLNRASWKNTITNNNVSTNTYGIYLNSACIENTITNNNVSNSDEGILLSDKDSSENNISGNNVSSNTYGIRLFGSESNNITRNTANWNTYYGIYLSEGSSENIITQNTASNNYNGIYITESSDNICYLNNFANKADNVYSYKSTNTWNSTEKKTYIFKGLTYENYMGNYWSDYTGSDTDNNGIGDTCYSIDSDKDNYPLPVPWENYFAPPENHPPTATKIEPTSDSITIEPGDTQEFRVKAKDVDEEEHNNLKMIEWFVDDVLTETDPADGTSAEVSFSYTFENAGTFYVKATVYDEQMEEDSVTWEVNVGENVGLIEKEILDKDGNEIGLKVRIECPITLSVKESGYSELGWLDIQLKTKDFEGATFPDDYTNLVSGYICMWIWMA
jgi:parallel beta-helix repeat protein